MKVAFDYLPEFEKRAKALSKKYKSFVSDYNLFLDELEQNPFGGVSLGASIYKHRMAITSKGKGKSGGARIITYNLLLKSEEEVVITLMTIYDKNEMDNVSDAYLKSLVKEVTNK